MIPHKIVLPFGCIHPELFEVPDLLTQSSTIALMQCLACKKLQNYLFYSRAAHSSTNGSEAKRKSKLAEVKVNSALLLTGFCLAEASKNKLFR